MVHHSGKSGKKLMATACRQYHGGMLLPRLVSVSLLIQLRLTHLGTVPPIVSWILPIINQDMIMNQSDLGSSSIYSSSQMTLGFVKLTMKPRPHI